MPDPTKLLTTLNRAVNLFRSTPGRRGHIVYLDADEVFATGDLHGNLDNLKAILSKADLARHPRRHLVLQEFIHGPQRYPDGSDKSHQALDVLAALKCQYPERVHFLLGNHELAQRTDQWIGKAEDNLNGLFRRGVDTAYGSQAEMVYQAYLDLFDAVPVALRTANRVFLSHSLPSAARLNGFDPAVLERDELSQNDLLPGGAVYALVWGRDVSSANTSAFLKKVDADFLISGHIACDQGFAMPNERQIILDSLGSPAGYVLLSTTRLLTSEDLKAGTGTL
jgi:hypothetical protein